MELREVGGEKVVPLWAIVCRHPYAKGLWVAILLRHDDSEDKLFSVIWMETTGTKRRAKKVGKQLLKRAMEGELFTVLPEITIRQEDVRDGTAG